MSLGLGLTLTGVACSSGCQPGTPAPDTSPTPVVNAGADSLVLERTVCFGTCPAYRVRVDRAGRIHFRSLDPSDPDRTATDSVSPNLLDSMVNEADRMGFEAMPDTIVGSRFCPQAVTDNPTATVTIFRSDKVSTVVDYHGCMDRTDPPAYPELARLRGFERSIDVVLKTERWARPSRP